MTIEEDTPGYKELFVLRQISEEGLIYTELDNILNNLMICKSSIGVEREYLEMLKILNHTTILNPDIIIKYRTFQDNYKKLDLELSEFMKGIIDLKLKSKAKLKRLEIKRNKVRGE